MEKRHFNQQRQVPLGVPGVAARRLREYRDRVMPWVHTAQPVVHSIVLVSLAVKTI